MTNRTLYSGPVVVGGVGGSGTRVVAMFLRELGFYLGNDLNTANDNLWFGVLLARPKWFVESSDEEIFKGLHLFEKAMIGRLGPSRDEIGFIVKAVIEVLFSDYLHWGKGGKLGLIKFVVKKIWPIKRVVVLMWLIKRIETMTRSKKFDSSAYIGWGWKEPNSHIYIKHLNIAFDNLKYIHVMRHGLDMVYSSNQAQLHNWGRLFGVQIPASPDLLPKASLQYWIKANKKAMTLGQQLLGERFLIINFDELCTEPQTQIEKLINFLELDKNEVNVNKLCSLCKTPRSLGRYQDYDISIFSQDEIKAVRELGFIVNNESSRYCSKPQ